MIIKFGPINIGNHNNLENLSKFVRESIGKDIDIELLRKYNLEMSKGV